MTIGDKIKKIRTFRNMTQAELGAALGWGDKGANRLAQYETNYWVPRKDLVTEMAKILDVNPLTLHEPTTMDAQIIFLLILLFYLPIFLPILPIFLPTAFLQKDNPLVSPEIQEPFSKLKLPDSTWYPLSTLVPSILRFSMWQESQENQNQHCLRSLPFSASSACVDSLILNCHHDNIFNWKF